MENFKDFYERYHKSYFVSILFNPGNKLKNRNITDLLTIDSQESNIKILDVGCGVGDLAHSLNNITTGNIYLLDISLKALKLSQKLLSTLNRDSFYYTLGEAQYLPFSEQKFDYVICSEVLEHLPDDLKALREIHRVLGPKGKAIITVPFMEKNLNEGHLRRYNINTFHELVESAEFVVEKEIYSGRILIKLSKIIKRRVGGMTEKESNLYNTFIYRKFVMPVLDRLLFLVDSLFNKKPNSIIGDEATLIALLRKEEIQ